jgi:hypothetical protein
VGRSSTSTSPGRHGNEYRDFLGNYTSLILGHAHPEVVAAVESQVRRGSAFAAPTETEIEQVFPGSSLVAPDGLTPQAALFLGLLVDGFHLAPRGMGALATPTTRVDVDELAAAVLSRLGALQAVPAA